MEGRYYSIGEVSRMMGISVQTLRHYCNIGLLTPAYQNPQTGYRYFSFEQLQYADRARYLLKCGFSLQEITDILRSGDVPLLIRALASKKKEQLKKIKDAIDVLATLDWYRDYFQTAITPEDSLTYCVRHLSKRSLVGIRWSPEDQFDCFYERFGEIRRQPPFSSIRFKRQFVSVWDGASLLRRQFRQTYIGMVPFDVMPGAHEHVLELPEGDYYCFQAAILEGDWNEEILKTILDGKPAPQWVVTLEMEDNLKSFQHCLHEVQIMF